MAMSENRRKWLIRFVPFTIFLIAFLFMLSLPLAKLGQSWNPITFIVLVLVIAGIPITIVAEKQFLTSPSYQQWQTTAAEMGLQERKDEIVLEKGRSAVHGNYRNHNIRIYETDESNTSEQSDYYTNYAIEFENHALIEFHLKKHSVFSRLKTDIKVGDPVFDRQFEVKGTKELDIQALFDTSFRGKFMSLGNISSASVHMNSVQYVFHHPIRTVKKDAERFRFIMNAMIDIVERIEAYTSPV